MFQKAHQHVAVIRWGQTKVLRLILEADLRTADLGNAGVFRPKEENVEWYSEFGEVLWIDEGSLSTEHLETGLQPQGLEGKTGVEPSQLWRS